MEAGRALDAEVAEKVMGWQRVSVGELYFWPTDEMVADIRKRHPDVLAVDYFPAPEFSTDIAAAWQVIEKLLTITPQGDIHLEKLCGVGWKVSSCFDKAEGGWDGWIEGETAPLAICLAALAAVGAEVPA